METVGIRFTERNSGNVKLLLGSNIGASGFERFATLKSVIEFLHRWYHALRYQKIRLIGFDSQDDWGQKDTKENRRHER